MILFINTKERENIKLTLCNSHCSERSYPTKGNQLENILSSVDQFLSDHETEVSKIKAIAVQLGPGSFNGLRTGVTVANTFAWALNIPVVGYTDESVDEILFKIMNQLKQSRHFTKPAIPHYPPIK